MKQIQRGFCHAQCSGVGQRRPPCTNQVPKATTGAYTGCLKPCRNVYIVFFFNPLITKGRSGSLSRSIHEKNRRTNTRKGFGRGLQVIHTKWEPHRTSETHNSAQFQTWLQRLPRLYTLPSDRYLWVLWEAPKKIRAGWIGVGYDWLDCIVQLTRNLQNIRKHCISTCLSECVCGDLYKNGMA